MKKYSILLGRPWADYPDNFLAHVEATCLIAAVERAIEQVREADDDIECENEYSILGEFEGHVQWAST